MESEWGEKWARWMEVRRVTSADVPHGPQSEALSAWWGPPRAWGAPVPQAGKKGPRLRSDLLLWPCLGPPRSPGSAHSRPGTRALWRQHPPRHPFLMASPRLRFSVIGNYVQIKYPPPKEELSGVTAHSDDHLYKEYNGGGRREENPKPQSWPAAGGGVSADVPLVLI